MSFINNVLEHLDSISQSMLGVGLAIFWWVEMRKPRVRVLADRGSRWLTNLALYAIGAILMALAFDPFSAFAIQLGGAWGWGGLAATDWPTWVKVVVGVLLIDLIQYVLHVSSHHIPWWWRLHKIHHSDFSMDASTSVRHHPLETFLNGFVVVVLLAAGGLPLYAILLYAALQQLHALFCHANVALPSTVDRWLRWVVITPDMHIVHHSVRMDEGNSNFGLVFPWWDRLFRTYCAHPMLGLRAMRLGVAELANGPSPKLLGLLGLPFRGAGATPTESTSVEPPSRNHQRRHRARKK